MDDLVAEIPSLFQFPRQPHPIDGGEDVEIRTRNATLCQIAILIETLHEFVSRFQEPPLDIFGRCFPGPQDWHGSNAGHSSGVAQGQRSLNRCSGRDFQHEVFAPTATAAFHSQTVAAGMLLPQRPTRRVLSCATAKLLRDEAESMVPNIDPEQVRKLAGWGLTQNDRASFVGWSQSLL